MESFVAKQKTILIVRLLDGKLICSKLYSILKDKSATHLLSEDVDPILQVAIHLSVQVYSYNSGLFSCAIKLHTDYFQTLLLSLGLEFILMLCMLGT